MLLNEYVTADGVSRGFSAWCPGCEVAHGVGVAGPEPRWEFNGNMESPTFSPSVLVTWTFGEKREPKKCHSFIRDGQWQFLGDCTHKLAGRTVPMVHFGAPLPGEGEP